MCQDFLICDGAPRARGARPRADRHIPHRRGVPPRPDMSGCGGLCLLSRFKLLCGVLGHGYDVMVNVCAGETVPVPVSSTSIDTDCLTEPGGVPEISPVFGLMVSHAGGGGAPAAKRHIYGPVPPLTVGVKVPCTPLAQRGGRVAPIDTGVGGGTAPCGGRQPNDCAVLFSKYFFTFSFTRLAYNVGLASR